MPNVLPPPLSQQQGDAEEETQHWGGPDDPNPPDPKTENAPPSIFKDWAML